MKKSNKKGGLFLSWELGAWRYNIYLKGKFHLYPSYFPEFRIYPCVYKIVIPYPSPTRLVHYHCTLFSLSTMITDPPRVLAVNARFESMADLKLACHNFAVANTFEYKFIKADKKRLTIRCKNEKCPWRLHASIIGISPQVMIRTFEEKHVCYGIIGSGHKNVSAKSIASKIKDKVRVNPSYGGAAVREDVHLDLGIKISKSMAYRAKELAFVAINGTYEESYESLPKYCVDLVATNPDTVAIVESRPSVKNPELTEFSRMFVSFGAAGKGFSHCRPLLGLDGTHLKSKYKGILLAATGVDACGNLFPLAHAVVDAETEDNWD